MTQWQPIETAPKDRPFRVRQRNFSPWLGHSVLWNGDGTMSGKIVSYNSRGNFMGVYFGKTDDLEWSEVEATK